MKFVIEKRIPIPPKRNKYGFPFSKMRVSESFFTEFGAVQQAAAYYSKKHPERFLVRKEGNGKRCWRIK